MTEAEFWQTTPRFFDAKVRAWESRMKYEFEKTRTSSFLISSPYLKKSATLNRFWPSPWERTKAVKWEPIDPAVLANFDRNADDVLAQMKGTVNGNDQRT